MSANTYLGLVFALSMVLPFAVWARRALASTERPADAAVRSAVHSHDANEFRCQPSYLRPLQCPRSRAGELGLTHLHTLLVRLRAPVPDGVRH